MSISEILNFGYYGLIALAIAVWGGFKLYSLNHTIKNKWLAQIPDLAAAFVHQAETTNNNGSAKMDNVVTNVCNILRKNHINITTDIENAIKAYAEKELATTINADKAKSDKEVTNNETK
ncbi:phage holin, LLH family [Lactobacillus huangpiensis]|uniref:phage holin, LLH family n=1 Tax=Lactobacillus huangpiensis TaxID=2799571 RepID=UPI001CC789ED|nr:phage holin, LLH family [Lactobacillus huangpiensis]